MNDSKVHSFRNGTKSTAMLNLLDTMPLQSMQLWTLDMRVMGLGEGEQPSSYSNQKVRVNQDTQQNNLARQNKTTNARSTSTPHHQGGPYGA